MDGVREDWIPLLRMPLCAFQVPGLPGRFAGICSPVPDPLVCAW